MSKLIVCHSSSACRQQLQIPNDATSYDPIKVQSGRLSLIPQLTGPAGCNTQTAERTRSRRVLLYNSSTVYALYCLTLRSLREEETQRVKSAAVSLNSAPPDHHRPGLRLHV